MTDIEYIGELIWPGKLAHFLIILSFFSALLAFFSYFRATKQQNNDLDADWKILGRVGFGLHGTSTLSLIAIIFWLMVNKHFEYAYVFEHVSNDLDMRYVFSAFWEGQEGSFLLWMFWHVILGFILMFKSGQWEAPVLCILALIEAFLASMLLGVYFELGDFLYKIGSNPTLLLRDVMVAPAVFNKADYLEAIPPLANGLNPLLQNYWMTIHPPTLFLGFASTAIPFCFSIAGLWTGKHKEILSPLLKWSLFSGFILGTGILMGAAWAYEALSFGGYWAWDPVENMSLVPWLVLIGGIHCNLIARATKYSIKSTYLFYILTFILILYSTFMTRSGVLGESSVHSFTDMGLEWQLVALVACFTLLGFGSYFAKVKSIPVIEKEEDVSSREFWMFIGAIVLLFSGLVIAYSTSLPVYNKIASYFNPDFTGRVITDVIPHYNKYQIWIAVFVTILSAKTIYTPYRKSNFGHLIKTLSPIFIICGLIAAVLTYFSVSLINLHSWQYIVLALCGYFSILTNLYYLIVRAKLNLKMAGAAVSHFGFAVMVIGILASGLNEHAITVNQFAMEGLMKEESLKSSINLIKGEPMFANNYWLTYVNDTIDGHTRTFEINFREVDDAGQTLDTFTLHPNILYTNDFSKVATANPDTKHFLTKDIFTDITSLPKSQSDAEFAKEMEDSIRYELYEGFLDDTIFTKKNYVVIQSATFDPSNPNFKREENDFGIEVKILVGNASDEEPQILSPALGVKDNLVFSYPGKADPFKFKVKLDESILSNFFTSESDLSYETFAIKEGDSFAFGDYKIQLTGFDREPEHISYSKQKDDIAVGALLDITGPDKQFEMTPIFIVRNMSPMNVKDYNIREGIHIRFIKVDPNTETYTFQCAKDNRLGKKVPLLIGENAPRTDFISYRARVMPGINLFWIGSVSMMLGLLLGFINRLRWKNPK